MITKIRYGNPEKLAPSCFAPQPKAEVKTGNAADYRQISFKTTASGCKLMFPIKNTTSIYGFGLQLKSVNALKKKKLLRVNSDPIADTGDTHAPVPFFVTTEGYGMYIDTARYAEIYCGSLLKPKSAACASKNKVNFTTDLADLYNVSTDSDNLYMTVNIPAAKGVDIYYITGDTILDIVCQYNMLSGGGCMPPLWGLGCFYRCEIFFNDEKVLNMAKKFRDLDIPCDIIGLEPGWQTRTYSSSLVWSNERFPNPKETAEKLSEMGFHLNLWQHSYIHPESPLYNDMLPYSGNYLVWNGLVPDFATEDGKKIYSDYVKKSLVDVGVSGFKNDECDGSDYTGSWADPNCDEFPSGLDGEQYHTLFGTLYCQAIMKALGNSRTLSETRSIGSLAASYPFVLYSDLYGHKDFIRGLVNAGFSGLLWSPEVRHGESADDLIRRIQNVIFSPQALVNAFYLDDMPWCALDCTDRVRELFKLRMSLIPYLYSAFYDYHTTGKPPVRALVCDYQDEPESLNIENEYLFGDSMIVAPIISKDATTGDFTERKTLAIMEKKFIPGRDIWLPKGEWYDLFTGKKYNGGNFRIDTENIPVFVKAGTLLPFAKPVSHIDLSKPFEITLRSYGDTSSSVCKLITDDGVSYSTEYKVDFLTENSVSFENIRYKVVNTEKFN